MKNQMDSKSASVGTKPIEVALAGTLPESITPENIATVAAYHINYNIWGTLLKESGKPSIGRLLSVSDDKMTYEFAVDQGAYFSNGRRVEAEDVSFSFSRLLRVEKSGHFNAKSLISSIITDGDRVSLTLTSPTPAFLYLLSTPEFGVLAKEQVDLQTDRVRDLQVTSGPYKVLAKNQEKGTIELAKNIYYKGPFVGPSLLKIRFGTYDQALASALREGTIDFAEVMDSKADATLAGALESKDIGYATSRPSITSFLIRNQMTLSEEQGQSVAFAVAKHFSISSVIEKKANQLLPEKTLGSLPAPIGPEKKVGVKLPDPLVIKYGSADSPMAKALQALGPHLAASIKLVDHSYEGAAHFTFYGQGMNSDHPEIEMHLALAGPYAFVAPTKGELDLLRAAEVEASDEKRISLIQKLVASLTDSAKLVPLSSRGYLHIFNKKRLAGEEFNNYDGDLHFHLLRLK